MGSKPKAGAKTAPQMMSYGGTNMSQADAQAKYQADMAAWRAPTTTGTGTFGMDPGNVTAAAPAAVEGGNGVAPTHLGVPTTDWSAQGLGAGPALPAIGVLPQAPIAVPRQTLAQVIRRNPYVGGRGGSSSNYGGSGGYGHGSASSPGYR